LKKSYLHEVKVFISSERAPGTFRIEGSVGPRACLDAEEEGEKKKKKINIVLQRINPDFSTNREILVNILNKNSEKNSL
jgi:hypothetical protein